MNNLKVKSWALISIFLCFIACDDWEDDQNLIINVENPEDPSDPLDPNDPSTPPSASMLLKMKKYNYEDHETWEEYTYDDQKRLIKVFSYGQEDPSLHYSEMIFQYISSTLATSVSNVYVNGNLLTQVTNTYEHLDDATIKIITESDVTGEIISTATYSQPCGVHTMENVSNFMGTPMTSVMTYEFTDDHCSYKEFVDGQWEETVTKDNQNSPEFDLFSDFMHTKNHNIVKVVSEDGSIRTTTYQYNEEGYPIHASHTFNEASMENPFTVTYTYY